jgi:hypothetical protein
VQSDSTTQVKVIKSGDPVSSGSMGYVAGIGGLALALAGGLAALAVARRRRREEAVS